MSDVCSCTRVLSLVCTKVDRVGEVPLMACVRIVRLLCASCASIFATQA